MPVTSRPSFTLRTVPRKRTVAPLALLLTRSIIRATSIGASTIAENISASRNRWNESDFVSGLQLAIARSVLLVHSNHRRRWQSMSVAKCAHPCDDVFDGCAGLDVELDLRPPDDIRV